MYSEPTVFILGAGASWHYGYPTGEDLVSEVISKCNELWKFYRRDAFDETQPRQYYQSLMQTDYIISLMEGRDRLQAYRLFFEQCKTLGDRLRQVNPLVIDYFLGQNKDLQVIGKTLIAWVLLERETETGSRDIVGGNNNHNHRRVLTNHPQWSQRDGGNIDITKYKDDWYRFIISELTSGCKEASDINKNKVHFITFNYDLSLESNLYSALCAIDLFKTEKNSIEKFFSDQKFLHVYGQLKDDFKIFEPLVFKRVNSEEQADIYSKILNKCYYASQNIQTIDPDNKLFNQSTLNDAKRLIKKAKKVYILGYGFDKNNNERLALNSSLNYERNDKEVYFTNYNNSELINKRASEIFSGNRSLFFYNSPSSFNLQGSLYERSVKNVYAAFEQDF